MTHKKKRDDTAIFQRLLKKLLFIPNVIYIISRLTTLVGEEARIASRSIILIIILAGMAIGLLVTIWFVFLALLLLYFVSLHWPLSMGLLVILILNLILFFILVSSLLKMKNNLFLPVMCAQLLKIKNILMK